MLSWFRKHFGFTAENEVSATSPYNDPSYARIYGKKRQR
jgi:hypothetical protein